MRAPGVEVVRASTSEPVASSAGPPTGRRFARALAASGTATSVALLLHLAAGGAAPGVLGVVVPLLLATSVCLVLAQVRLPWLRLMLSVGVSQVFFHLLFSLGAAAPVGAAQHAGASGHGHGALPDAGAAFAPAADHAAHAAHVVEAAHTGHAGGAMWLAHLVAALVTVAALRHGEAVLVRLGSALRRAGRRLVRARVAALPVRPHRPAAPLADDRAWQPVARLLVSASVARRGPPVPVLP